MTNIRSTRRWEWFMDRVAGWHWAQRVDRWQSIHHRGRKEWWRR